MKKIYKKEEGVSPVIATILMVAITVVLAATVWLLVSGYLGGTSQPSLTASLTYDTQNSNPAQGEVYLTVAMSNPSTADFTKVTISIEGKTGTLGSSGTTTITLTSGAKYNIAIMDNDGNSKLSSGDIIHISYDSGGSASDISGAIVTLSVTGYTGTTPSVTIP